MKEFLKNCIENRTLARIFVKNSLGKEDEQILGRITNYDDLGIVFRQCNEKTEEEISTSCVTWENVTFIDVYDDVDA